MKRFIFSPFKPVRSLSVVLCLIFLIPAYGIQAKELRMLLLFSKKYVFGEVIADTFVNNVREASAGKINISLYGPDAVPPMEQFDPLKAGVFDLLIHHPIYHSEGVGVAIEATDNDPAKRRESGVWDFVDVHYRETHKVKLIAIAPLGTKSSQYILREPVSKKSPGLKGLRIRCVDAYESMTKSLGGIPINIPANEAYAALAAGTVDGMAFLTTGIIDLKLYEQVKYLTRPVFGRVHFGIYMNLNAYEGKLTPDEQKLIDEQGRNLEISTLKRMDEKAAEELAELKKLGMKETQFAPEDATRLDDLWTKGVWEVAEKKAGDKARKFREFIKSKGMTMGSGKWEVRSEK